MSPPPWVLPVVNRGPGQFGEGVAVVEQVDADVPVLRQMPALDQHVPRSERVQHLGRLVLPGAVAHVDAGQQPHLVEVGRDDGGAGEQHRAVGVEGVVGEERDRRASTPRPGRRPAASGRRSDPGPVAGLGDRADDRRRRQHPRLDRVEPDVGGDGLDLRGDRLRRQRVHPGDPEEFCTVTAVTATQPCTPHAARVRRSAATPAPPPESVPAIVMTRGGVTPTVRSPMGPPVPVRGRARDRVAGR